MLSDRALRAAQRQLAARCGPAGPAKGSSTHPRGVRLALMASEAWKKTLLNAPGRHQTRKVYISHICMCLHMLAGRVLPVTASSTHTGDVQFNRYSEDEGTLERDGCASNKEEGAKQKQRVQEQPVAAAGAAAVEAEQATGTSTPMDVSQQDQVRLVAKFPCMHDVAEAEQATGTSAPTEMVRLGRGTDQVRLVAKIPNPHDHACTMMLSSCKAILSGRRLTHGAFRLVHQVGCPDKGRAMLAVPQEKGISGLAASDRPDIPTAAASAIRADAGHKGRLCGYATMHTFTHSGQQLSAAVCTPHMPCLPNCTVPLKAYEELLSRIQLMSEHSADVLKALETPQKASPTRR